MPARLCAVQVVSDLYSTLNSQVGKIGIRVGVGLLTNNAVCSVKGVTQRVPVTDSCQACTGKDLDLNLEAWNMVRAAQNVVLIARTGGAHHLRSPQFYPGVPADKFYEATWEWA